MLLLEKVAAFLFNNLPALRYPMNPYINLTHKDVAAIYAYLKTIPKIKNKVDRGV